MSKKDNKSARTYKMIELVGTSKKSYEEAIQNAIADASDTLEGLDWFQVTEFRGAIKDGKIAEFQAVMKVGFRVLRSRAAPLFNDKVGRLGLRFTDCSFFS